MKKILALTLTVMMALTACSNNGGTTTQSTGSGADSTATANTQTEAVQTENQEIAQLKWVTVGNGMPLNYDAWKENTNAYLAEAIGVNLDVEVVSWSNWSDRRNVIVSSGEYFDILFTDSGRYSQESKMGAFMDIEDMLKSNAGELYSYIPEDYWDAVRIDGNIYAVPTYKDSSMTNYFIWDKDLAEENGIDYGNITTLADLQEPLAKLRDVTGGNSFIMDKNGASTVLSRYDKLGSELEVLGVRFDDESRQVVNILEQAEVVSDLELVHQMYNDGIINADAPTLGESPSYRMFLIAQGWSGAAISTWGPNNGMNAVAIQHDETIVSNSTVRGSLNAIYSGSNNPEKALELIQLVNLDGWVRDALYYGLEGDNFEYTSDGKVERLNTDWTMAGYTQGTFFNVSLLSSDEFNQWDEVKQLNENATGSVMLGFDLDTASIETELANCRVIWDKYKSELLTGAREPNALIAAMNAELEASGFNTIMEEAQRQIDAAY